MRAFIFLAFLLSTISTARANTYVYVSVAGEKRIAIYEMDSQSGDLTHVSDVKTSGSPGPLTTDPERKFLFASIRSVGHLASFAIDQKTGGLTLLSEVSADADPAFVSTDKTGRFLFSAYYAAGKAAVHPISPDGKIGEKGQWVDTAKNAHAILTESTNRFAFVPHTGPNMIARIPFDVKTGKFDADNVVKTLTPKNTGPRHVGFHPRLDVVYFDNEQGSSVTAYHLNRKTGAIKPFQTLSTLPKGYQENNSNAHLELSPSGRFVYASNRGHDSIAMFSIDEKSGVLTSLGQVKTEQTPRSFNIEPSGNFLFAAGQSSGKVASYRVDPKTGKLRRLKTYTVGKQPWWVLGVQLDK